VEEKEGGSRRGKRGAHLSLYSTFMGSGGSGGIRRFLPLRGPETKSFSIYSESRKEGGTVGGNRGQASRTPKKETDHEVIRR